MRFFTIILALLVSSQSYAIKPEFCKGVLPVYNATDYTAEFSLPDREGYHRTV